MRSFFVIILILLALPWFVGCTEKADRDCENQIYCPDDDTPCGDDDNNDDNDGSPATPTPDDRPPVSLKARINYSDAWTVWKLRGPNEYHSAFSAEIFSFDENDIPIISETNHDDSIMILHAYINKEWRERQFTDYENEHANYTTIDNKGKIALLSTADSGSFYISSFDNNYESRTVRPACSHVSSGYARLAFMADDSPYIIFGGDGLYSCVYYPWADNWYVQPLLPFFISSGLGQEIVQDTNGYVAVFYWARDFVTDEYYWGNMRKRFGIWQHAPLGELDGFRFHSYTLLDSGRFADGRVYFLMSSNFSADQKDIDSPRHLQLYETGPEANQPWARRTEADFYHYREKDSIIVRIRFHVAPDGTVGAFVLHYLDDPHIEGKFDLFGVYSEYRDGQWKTELVDYPDYPEGYRQEDLIFDYDSQNRPGIAVHLEDGSIYFLWRNLE